MYDCFFSEYALEHQKSKDIFINEFNMLFITETFCSVCLMFFGIIKSGGEIIKNCVLSIS